MICPNCKTELVEVNGRYICSDCGREIPENEVMASDWGNGGTVRAGLYGAGTDEVPEDGSKPINDYDTSLTESEGESQPPVPDTGSVTPEAEVEPSVEEILQDQSVQPETAPEVPAVDTGFYTPEVAEQSAISNQQSTEAEIPVATPEVVVEGPTLNSPEQRDGGSDPLSQDSLLQGNDNEIKPEPPVESVAAPEIPVIVPEVPLESVTSAAQEIPITVPEAPVEVPVVPTPEVEPEHSEVVKDMFENVEPAVTPQAPDPGIYTDPMYENGQASDAPAAVPATANAPMPVDKRMNLIILIGGAVLVLLLLVGGTWGYLALNAKVQPVTPTPTPEVTAWQELQSVDGGFQISFPGEPTPVDETRIINGAENNFKNYTYTDSDITYSVGYATLDADKAKVLSDSPETTLFVLAKEAAVTQKLNLTDPKVGKYFTSDAIDFNTVNQNNYVQNKLIINGNKYILISAGGTIGNKNDYDKFKKSFSLLTPESTN